MPVGGGARIGLRIYNREYALNVAFSACAARATLGLSTPIQVSGQGRIVRVRISAAFMRLCFGFVFVVLFLASGVVWGASSRKTKDRGLVSEERPASPGQSEFFSSGTEEAYSTYQMAGDGDLWPTCWADDDNLYTANGDGAAFTGSDARPDMQVSRISGEPPHLVGTPLASDVGTNWSGQGFNRKPTGMLCLHGAIYLAFQNLDKVGFNSAPAASIARSTDHGKTWTWDSSAPMFGGPGKPPLFTTVFFLDFGKNSADAIDHYVYAYGLDNNWRSQQAMFLARVPEKQVMLRNASEFYAGTDNKGTPQWTKQIADKQPVLLDTRMVQAEGMGSRCPVSDAVIAQGGVVYDKPLKRYLFTSWSCSTHEPL